MTLHDALHKRPRAPVMVVKRVSGAENVPGVLVLVYPHRRLRDPQSEPVALVEFSDGVEPIHLDDIVENPLKETQLQLF